MEFTIFGITATYTVNKLPHHADEHRFCFLTVQSTLSPDPAKDLNLFKNAS